MLGHCRSTAHRARRPALYFFLSLAIPALPAMPHTLVSAERATPRRSFLLVSVVARHKLTQPIGPGKSAGPSPGTVGATQISRLQSIYETSYRNCRENVREWREIVGDVESDCLRAKRGRPKKRKSPDRRSRRTFLHPQNATPSSPPPFPCALSVNTTPSRGVGGRPNL